VTVDTIPRNLDAERSVLGCMMLDPTFIASAGLESDDFYQPRHRSIFASLLRLAAERQDPSDVVLLSADLQQHGDLESVGGIPYLAEVVASAGAAAMGPHYANLVQGAAYARRLVLEARTLIRSVEEREPIQEVADRMRVACEQPAGRLSSKAEKGQQFRDTYARGNLPYLPTVLPRLDEHVGGYPIGGTTVIAGRPSSGKTATALCIAVAQAMGEPVKVDEPIPVLYQSCESTHDELYQRAMCQYSWQFLRQIEREGDAVLLDDVIKRRLPIGDVNDWSRGVDEIPLYIARDSVNMHRLLAQARQYVHRHGIRSIVLDLVNKVSDSEVRGKDVKRRTIERTVHNDSELSKELGVSVVLLCQLNRDAEGIMEPSLRHLKQAGEIEEDADVVLMLARKNKQANWGRCTIRKNRDGIADAGFNYDFIGRHMVVRGDTDGRSLRQRMKDGDVDD